MTASSGARRARPPLPDVALITCAAPVTSPGLPSVRNGAHGTRILYLHPVNRP